jgi:hypothetical protein
LSVPCALIICPHRFCVCTVNGLTPYSLVVAAAAAAATVAVVVAVVVAIVVAVVAVVVA